MLSSREGTMIAAFLLSLATAAIVGPLAGMSLDQAAKQLPARHRIGVVAYSAYSRAADLKNGVYLYPPLGIAAVICGLAAALAGHLQGLPSETLLPLDLGAALAVAHAAVTAKAAPINLSQHKLDPADETRLARVFDRFALWNGVRAILQVANFAASLWATVLLGRGL